MKSSHSRHLETFQSHERTAISAISTFERICYDSVMIDSYDMSIKSSRSWVLPDSAKRLCTWHNLRPVQVLKSFGNP